MSNYLLEIGVEEFPAKHINSTKEQFNNKINKVLVDNGYTYEKLTTNSTPRRFSFIVENIERSKENSVEKVKGPSKKIAFDGDNNPTKALEGFCKSKGVEISQITIEEVNGEEYTFANIKSEVKKLDTLLKEEIPNIIKSISNPRQMRWGGKNISFLRPIRWIVSILDDNILEFDLEGIKVSNITKGHRTLGKDHIVIEKISEYKENLKENYVILSEEERKNIIIKGINRLAKEKGGNYLSDDRLLEEVIYINEYPTPFIGEFDNKYLSLPKEIIVTPMKDHQRYFPVEDDSGDLLPYFISVRNGDLKGIENVIEGNKKVLVARLEDAKFFFDKDSSMSLEEYLPKLEYLGYHEGLGNMLDKTNRLQNLVISISSDIECGDEATKIASRAAYLSKADLVTNTVIEFTELQGIMGRIFAEKSGENPLVAKAIEEQYMPRSSNGELPSTTSGLVLSIADKIDTISGLYSKGIEVTGSQDIYGQRRAVLGILNILLENKINLNIEKVVKDALYNYVDSFGETFDYNEITEKIMNFIYTRYRNLLLDKGFRYDIVDSVLNSNNKEICSVYNRINVLNEILVDNKDLESSEENIELENIDIDQLLEYFVRIINMSKKAESKDINNEYLKDEDLLAFETIIDFNRYDKLVNEGKIREAIKEIGEKSKIISNYLDNTLVMDDDENVRNNRLAIVKTISDKIKDIFDPIEIVR